MLHVQISSSQSFKILLNIAAELAFFVLSDRVFESKAPLNIHGLFPDAFVFLSGS